MDKNRSSSSEPNTNDAPAPEITPDVQAVPEQEHTPPKKSTSAILLTAAAYLLAFCIPTIIVLLMYKVKEIAPFGDRSVLCRDLSGQYTPMYAQLAHTRTLGDLFYSWNGGLGYNNWAQSGYYCNSIFLLPLRLVSIEHLVNYINWMCLLKFGCAGVSALAFLRFKTKSRSPFLIAGACIYSLCAYMLAFLSQPMWTDCVIYAPLLLIGMDRMLHQKKPLMYVLMLTLTICSSFYIGFAVCIFCCLYFASEAIPTLKLSKNADGKISVVNLKDFGTMTGRFSVYSILAGLMAAPVILPVLQAISLTIASESGFPEKFEWYDNISAVFGCMFSEQPLYLEYDNANLSVGMIAFLLLPLYFLNKQIPAVRRIVDGVLLGFLMLSLNCNILNFMWHGFHFPNQLPGRWTFLFSLFVVLLICTAFVNRKGLTISRMIGGFIIGCVAVYLGMKGLGETEGAEVRSIYLILMAVSAAILLIMAVLEMLRSHATKKETTGSGRIPYNVLSVICTIALASVCITDSGMSIIHVAQFENSGLRTTDGKAYTETFVRQSKFGGQWVCGDDEFYRVIENNGFTFNPSMIGGYHGMEYYSSTMRGSTFEFLKSLGNRVYAKNVSSVYIPTSPVQNSLFGIRYYIDRPRSIGDLPAAEVIESNSECDIVENKTALSVAFGASNNVLSYEVSDQIRAIQNQNTFLNAIVGEDVNVFRKLYTTKFGYNNATLLENADWNQNYFQTTDSTQPVTFHYVYTCDADGAIYLEHNFRAGTITVTYGDETRNVDQGTEKFAYLGNFAAGDEITIDVEISGINLGCTGLNLYYFEEERWNSAYEKLSAIQLDVTEFRADRIRGSIDLPQGQFVMTTIPQDGGWKAYCDGEPLDIMLAADDLICVSLPKGTHTLEFRYHVPLLGAGIAISAAALLICLWISVPALRRFVFAKLTAHQKG